MLIKFSLLLFLTNLIRSQPNPEFGRFLESCAQEYDVDMAIIRNRQEIPEDKKCFHKCMAIKLGIMNDQDELTLEDFKTKLINEGAPARMIENVENCNVTPQPDPCDTALALKNCIHPM